MTPSGATPVVGAPAYPPRPPMDPVAESLKLAAEVVHEQQEIIEKLLRCLCRKCCHDRDDDDGDRDRRRRRHEDRDDER